MKVGTGNCHYPAATFFQKISGLQIMPAMHNMPTAACPNHLYRNPLRQSASEKNATRMHIAKQIHHPKV
jgi:hypothetical protein